MRRANRNKRFGGARSQDRATFSLMVHGPEYGSGEEVVINPECFPQIKVHDLVEIAQPEREHQRLVLQVTSLAPVRGKLQVSVLKDIAAQFGLDPFVPVTVQCVDAREVTVDFIELTFKDQFLSRADIWRFKVAMIGRCVYVGKNVACLGVRSQVEGLLASNQELYCGVIGAETKMIVRSRSSRLFWLVQMSAEMWEFAPDGELYYEKLLDRLLRVMIAKWHDSSVSHSVTIIAFSRSFYDTSQFPAGFDPLAPPFSDPTRQGLESQCSHHHHGHDGDSNNGSSDCGSTAWSDRGPTIQVDPLTGRYYEDFYKVLVMNYTGPDWDHLLGLLKREFTSYHETHRWRSPEETIPADYVIHHGPTSSSLGSSGYALDRDAILDAASSRADDADCSAATNERERAAPPSRSESCVHWHALPFGIPSRAMDGNILEAINVTLNILDKHYMDRDLNRTGQSIVMITAGCSIFHVDARLAQITKQRMMDNGVGMDMISLTTPPTHVVPLFICSTQTPRPDPTRSGGASHSPSREQQQADDSVRRQRKYSLSSENLNALETCSLLGLEKELSEFERWGSDDNDSNPAQSENQSADGDATDDLAAPRGQPQPQQQQQQQQNQTTTYSIPHWVNITFLDFDCRCGGSAAPTSVRGHKHPPMAASQSSSSSPSSFSPTNGSACASGRSQYNNRLLSHRAQMCQCQLDLNQRFLPLPPFRMFDLTAPTERLSFPVALRKLIRGYPRQWQRGAMAPLIASPLGSAGSGGDDHVPRPRRRLSDISDTLSLASASGGATRHDHVQIRRSPDFDVARSPPRPTQFLNAFTPSALSDDAFEEYDAEVFNASAILGPHDAPERDCAPPGFSPPRRSEHDLTSATFSGGDMHPLELAMAAVKHSKWASAAAHLRGARGGVTKRGFGNSSSNSGIINSLLSPRNDVRALRQHGFGYSHSSVAALKPAQTFKRVATLQGLSTTTASGVAIPTISALKSHSMRKNSVYPKRELLRIGQAHAVDERLSSQRLRNDTADGEASNDTAEGTSPIALDSRALLSKSVESSSRRFLAAARQHKDNAAAGTSVMRQRACTSNAESSTTPPLLLPPGARDGSFQHLSRSMTMGKPSPSYYNDLLLRSPPPPPATASAAASPSLSTPHDGAYWTSARPNHTPGVVRRGHSEVLSTSVLSGAIANLAGQPLAPLERSGAYLSTNPFKYSTETLETASQRLTSDRRRWSHLFPVLTTNQQAAMGAPEVHQHGGVKPIHLGPNWKSLTSPAILPLTTDYYPSAKDLHTSYTESFYTLTLPSMLSETVPKYNNHDELLIEMVCQRLASDFQLVATDLSTDVDPALQLHHPHVPAVITHCGPSGESRAVSNNNSSVIYYLSMGHRIHQMIYDPELQTIDVKRYFQRAIQSPKHDARTYRYSLWVDRTASFHPLQQTFHEYPQPEENWNSLDHLLCGYHDEMSDVTKCRRIRFAVVPPRDAAASVAARAAYAAKFNKLIEFLQNRIAPAEDGVTERISIRIVAAAAVTATQDPSTEPLVTNTSCARVIPQQCGTLRYKICCKSSSCSSARSKSDDTRAEWIMVHLEDAMDAARNYHLDMRWLACSGIVADEFVSALKRKSKQSGLELRRVPEYSRVSFLQIHPLIAPIFLPLRRQHQQHRDHADDSARRSDGAVDAVDNSGAEQERVLINILVDRLDFVLDDERLADSNGIGYGLGIEREERKPLGGGGISGSASAGFKAHHYHRAPRRSASTAARLLAERWRARGYKQYIHRSAPVFLRLVHSGLVWIPSYDYDERSDAARVDELFREICSVVQASAALRDLVDSCCCTETA